MKQSIADMIILAHSNFGRDCSVIHFFSFSRKDGRLRYTYIIILLCYIITTIILFKRVLLFETYLKLLWNSYYPAHSIRMEIWSAVIQLVESHILTHEVCGSILEGNQRDFYIVCVSCLVKDSHNYPSRSSEIKVN